jgi:NADH dehydrogenase (ubiquinone) Fe-S protein 1
MITINDKNYNLESSNYTILQFCTINKIDIPRFCYHEKLSIAGNCRMCLIEDLKSIKPIAACAFNLMNNSFLYTNTTKVKKAREGVLEFLLLNHPLDCPICDQGGECDLQDESLIFGGDRGRFYEYKRAIEDKNCGPFIKTMMNRCIHCTRCVRFATEVAGLSVLGITGRGSKMEIGFYVSSLLNSEISGNIIDLCPVGALTSKPYSFTSRPWELKSRYTIDIFDSLLSDIRVDVRGNEVMRILPRINPEINEEWISDKIRFVYDSIQLQRLYSPTLRFRNYYIQVSWFNSLCFIKNYFINILDFLILNKLKLFLYDVQFGPLVDVKSIIALKTVSRIYGFYVGSNNVKASIYNSNFFFNLSELMNYKILIKYNFDARYISPILNLRLRRLYLKRGLLVFAIGTKVINTYYIKTLGLTFKTLKYIIEGRHWLSGKLSKLRGLILFSKNNINVKNYVDYIKNIFIHTSIFMPTSKDITSLLYNFPSTQKTKISSLFKLYCLHLMGSDDYVFTKLNRSNSNLIIYQGHHGDYSCYFSDVMLPATSFFEKNVHYLTSSGRYKETLPVASFLTNIRNDCDILKALGLFLGTLYTIRWETRIEEHSFLCSPVFFTEHLISYINKYSSIIINIEVDLMRYYTNNAMVASSNYLSLASSVFVNNLYNYA